MENQLGLHFALSLHVARLRDKGEVLHPGCRAAQLPREAEAELSAIVDAEDALGALVQLHLQGDRGEDTWSTS